MTGHWLFKSEPHEYSIDQLKADNVQNWNGCRNYHLRNMLRDQMKIGDKVLFYHSSCPQPGVVGVARIAKEGYPDSSAFDRKSKYFDPKSKTDSPRWYTVDVEFERKLDNIIPLSKLKECPELDDFPLVKRGNRLSIMSLTQEMYDFILSLEQKKSKKRPRSDVATP